MIVASVILLQAFTFCSSQGTTLASSTFPRTTSAPFPTTSSSSRCSNASTSPATAFAVTTPTTPQLFRRRWSRWSSWQSSRSLNVICCFYQPRCGSSPRWPTWTSVATALENCLLNLATFLICATWTLNRQAWRHCPQRSCAVKNWKSFSCLGTRLRLYLTRCESWTILRCCISTCELSATSLMITWTTCCRRGRYIPSTSHRCFLTCQVCGWVRDENSWV